MLFGYINFENKELATEIHWSSADNKVTKPYMQIVAIFDLFSYAGVMKTIIRLVLYVINTK